ncbi:MAG TPA: hypothetical protein VNU01_05520, partial [Egibacteraceae bacterium]|nr:hypothetical protein [Egibacteraceae bacterium]
WADEAMGRERADTLMKGIPPAGWGDVATKQDLEVLESRFSAKLADEIGGVHKEIGKVREAQTTHLITIVVAILVAMMGNTILPHYFPPPSPQIVVQVPSQ